jgi:hypothetical protein
VPRREGPSWDIGGLRRHAVAPIDVFDVRAVGEFSGLLSACVHRDDSSLVHACIVTCFIGKDDATSVVIYL